MWIDRIVQSPTTRAIELTARFAEERHSVLAENVANVDTPDFHTKRLDVEAFQHSLKKALDTARDDNEKRLNLRGDAQVWTGKDGSLNVKPVEEPAENVLFHDGTNARIEKIMTDVQQNEMSYNLAVNLLRGRFDSLLTAIRGRLA